jgi:CRP-like cAMP-binding protein
MNIAAREHSTNRLLESLPIRMRRSFIADCEQIELIFTEVLCEAGEAIRYVYFPTDSFISLVTTLNDGSRLEVGIVGDEGMLSMSLVLGVNTSSQHALVQGAGSALRMPAAQFNRHIRDSQLLRDCLNHYVCVLLRQLALTAACTHYHVVEERLARWLLLTRDRAHSDRFYLTHELLAYMLGVRRVGITRAAVSLHALGLISYHRGEIIILDAPGLERTSCHCYRESRVMYDNTLDAAHHVRISRPLRRNHS